MFTTTPAAVDLAGFSPTATYLTGSGFSNGNLCKIAVTDSSETVPTLTLTSAGSDFTVASFTNVNVHCTATGNFGLNNSSHLYFGEGSKFTMAGGGRFLVGNSISCSNSLVVAAGAKATVSKAFWIGCGSQNSLHPIGVVHVAGGELTVNESIFMGRHTSTADNHWKYGNGGTGVLWVESGTCNVNGEIISNAQYLNSGETSKYTQRTRIIVGKNGVLKVFEYQKPRMVRRADLPGRRRASSDLWRHPDRRRRDDGAELHPHRQERRNARTRQRFPHQHQRYLRLGDDPVRQRHVQGT